MSIVKPIGAITTKEVKQMIYRTLGGTGEKVSAIGVGGWHLGLKHVDEQLAIRIVRSAIDRGINFLDNSWDYSEGVSELRMGEALRDGYRQHAFVMTKIDGRSRKEAARQLERCTRNEEHGERHSVEVEDRNAN
jgi:aryl-alcohol dehydrogenase-like predicted oxidoreductase